MGHHSGVIRLSFKMHLSVLNQDERVIPNERKILRIYGVPRVRFVVWFRGCETHVKATVDLPGNRGSAVVDTWEEHPIDLLIADHSWYELS